MPDVHLVATCTSRWRYGLVDSDLQADNESPILDCQLRGDVCGRGGLRPSTDAMAARAEMRL